MLGIIDRRMDRLPGILKDEGYPDVQAFIRVYDNATALVEQYNRDLAVWEKPVSGKDKPRQKSSEKESIRKRHRELDAEANRQNAERQRSKKKSRDRLR